MSYYVRRHSSVAVWVVDRHRYTSGRRQPASLRILAPPQLASLRLSVAATHDVATAGRVAPCPGVVYSPVNANVT